MWAYVVRRLLLMIPTLLGILIINYAVLRMGVDPLRSEMSNTGSEEGAQDPKLLGKSIESALVRAHRSGKDLPALINLRGFLDKEDVVTWLQALERTPEGQNDEADRAKEETSLWIQGHFAAGPLYEVLNDPELEELHPAASYAFTFTAFTPLTDIDVTILSADERRAIQVRNQQLKELRIAYDNSFDNGYVRTDDQKSYDSKIAAIQTFWQNHEQAYTFGSGSRWGAILFETGFIDFFANFFTGKLESESFKRPVFELIGERWYVSFWLQILSVVIAWSIAVPLGIRSARRKNTLEDQATTNSLFILWSLPEFFIGSLLLYYFCTDRPGGEAWFPNRGLSSPDSLWYSTPQYLMDIAWHGFLPLLCLTYGSFTVLSRYMRGSMLDQMSADYARTARAKGCSEDRVIYTHNLRNSMVTMITMGSGLLAALFGGFVVVEYMFVINGLGTLLLEAARAQDAPLVMASTIISVGLLLLSILVADLLYAVADPRIRSRYV